MVDHIGSNLKDSKSVLVVSDLADNINENDLRIFFENYSEAIALIQIRSGVKTSSTTATIVFKEFKDADAARIELNLRKLKGKTVRITWHEKDTLVRYGNQFNLYVKNIPFNVSPRQVFEYFLQFGDIISAKVNENEDGEHYGYGYVNYSNAESMKRCIENTDNKEIWPGTALKVEIFQKRNERDIGLNSNTGLFVKNFPSSFDESKIRDVFRGLRIVWMKLNSDSLERKSAFICFDSEESALRAKQQNGVVIEGCELYVDNLMNKSERKRFLASKINEQNLQLSHQFRDCNLHIKNLPLEVNDEDLRNIFSAFGPVKSVKVQTQINATKIKGQFVETVVSCGFGYVCYFDSVGAKLAFDTLNGNLLNGYNSKKALEITYFMSKLERKQIQKGLNQQFKLNSSKPYSEPTINQTQQPAVYQNNDRRTDEPDYNSIRRIEDEVSKREILGEIIFKKIELHELSENHKLTFDHIGKITGMILGIEDTNEIFDICKNREHLTSRIHEALELLNSS